MNALNKLCEYLISSGTTIALAESCTGGLLSAMLVSYPGISGVYLCVREEIIGAYGAVSEQCAEAMAEGAKNSIGSKIGLSTTGIAGPGGGSLQKPVGLVYVGISLPQGNFSYKLMLKGTRKEIMEQAAEKAIELLTERLNINY